MEVLSLILWLSIGLFVLGIVLDERARLLSSAGWVLFGAYWLTRFPYYYNETHSMIKSVLTLLALPLAIYVAYEILFKDRDVLVRLSQAVAAMGLIYLPFATIEPLSNALIEHTAAQAYRGMQLLGVNAELTMHEGLERRFVVTNPETGESYATFIILACTGIGSMAIFGGLIAAVEAPLEKKLKALAVSIPVIYVLNLVRNVFIPTAYGYQWFPYLDDWITSYMNEPSGYASFFWADKVISQSLSVVALILIALLIVRYLPEVMDLVDGVLEIVLGESTQT